MKKITLYLDEADYKVWKKLLIDDELSQTEWFQHEVTDYLAAKAENNGL